MKATVAHADPESTSVSIELASGGPYLILHVSQMRPEHMPPDRRDSQFFRRIHLRLRRTGPRGGWRGEPSTVGFGYLDIRERPVPLGDFDLDARSDFDVASTAEEARELELEP